MNLPDRVDLIRLVTAEQPGGNFKEEEVPVRSNLPAKVVYEKGSERIRASRIEATQAGTVMIRLMEGVTTDHRLKHKGSTLRIHSVTQTDYRRRASDRGRFLELVVTKNG